MTTTNYGLHIPSEIERRIGRCRASVSGAIRERLREIAVAAGKTRSRPAARVVREPPLRSHVQDGYQVLYQVDSGTRRVVVLGFGLLPVGPRARA